MKVISENEVLGPADLKTHPDNWPIHHLRNVNVISHRTQQSVSLLESNKEHVVQVTGLLEGSKACRSTEKVWRSKRIEITKVSFWAFSENSNGSVSLWASGRAGWFELHDPVPQYRSIFDGMSEAVSMLYYLADKFKRLRKDTSCLSTTEVNRYVTSVFRDYAQSRGQQLVHSDADPIATRFHSHARFLITSMLEGQDNLDWHKSPFLKYFNYCFGDLYEDVESRLHHWRQPDQGTANLVVARGTAPKLHTPVAYRPGSTYFQTRDHTHGLKAMPRTPQVPKCWRMPVQSDVASGDESCDSNGKLVKTGTKRKSRSILRPKGSKFSKKAADRHLNVPVAADQMSEARSGSDDEVQSPEISPLAAVMQEEHEYQLRTIAKIKVMPYKIPSHQPQGPGDLWTCSLETCDYSVHEASKAMGKAQVEEHAEGHARRAQEKINLALSESRPYLPVSNLVRQIQLVQPEAHCFSFPVARRC